MALPVTYGTNVYFPAGKPHLVGSAVYLVAITWATNTTVRIYKATDPTSSFTEQDSTNAPTHGPTTTVLPGDSCLDGTIIRVVWKEGLETRYAEFDTSTDQWVDVNSDSNYYYLVDTSTNDTVEVSIAVRSDGDILIGSRLSNSTDMGTAVYGIYYHRWEDPSPSAWNTGWTTAVQVFDSATKFNDSYGNAPVAVGSSDVAFFSWIQASDLDFHIKGLSSGNSLWTQRTLTGTFGTFGTDGPINALIATQSGTEYHKISLLNAASVSVIEFNHVTSDTAPTITSNQVVASGIEFPWIAVDDSGTDDVVYLIYEQSSSGNFLGYEDGGSDSWSTLNSGSILNTTSGTGTNIVRAAIYTRSGSKVLAWFETIDEVYDEFVLEATPEISADKVLGVTLPTKVLGVSLYTSGQKVIGRTIG